jgi:prevent-host-death family protein
MKTMTVFEARNHFARTIEAAKDDVIIVTRNGRPVAAIQGIDDDDLEDLLLERSERFWTMIERARRGKPVAIETLRKQVTGGGRSGARAALPRKRVGRAAIARRRRA